jgi:hypothetical protein
MRVALHPVPFADILIGGELQRRALRNFDRMEWENYHPAQVFLGNEGWPGDLEGRIVLALVLLARATHRDPRTLDAILCEFPAHLNPQGYFGDVCAPDTVLEQQMSGHGWVLRGLCEHYRWTSDARTLALLQGMVQNLALPTRGAHRNYPIIPEEREHQGGQGGHTVDRKGQWLLSSDIGCDFIFLDGVVQAYEILGGKDLAALIDEMIARFLEVDLVAIKAQTHSTLTTLRAILRYAILEHKPPLVAAAEERYRLYTSLALTENYANWNWFGRPLWTEPCAFIDAFIVAVTLWQITGKPCYLEDAHHVYYNAYGHGQRQNGGFGCDSCVGPGCGWSDHDSPEITFSPFLTIKMEEAPACCSMRGGEGLARAVEYCYFTDEDSIVLPFFFDNEATLRLGNQTVTLKETTGYPYTGDVRLQVSESSGSQPVVLKFFAPSWTEKHRLTRNGQALAVESADGFVAVKTPLVQGDVFDLSFCLSVRRAKPLNPLTPNEYGTFRYGPLIVGLETNQEVRLDGNAEVDPEAGGRLRVRGTDIVLSPINDLIDRPAAKETYSRQILFR